MKKFSRSVLWVFTLMLSSCINEYPGAGCFHDLFISLEWQDTKPVTTEGKPVTVDVVPVTPYRDGETQQSDIYGTETNVIVGEYIIVGYEDADNVDVDTENQTVSVDSSEDDMAEEPGEFSAGSVKVQVIRDEGAPDINLPMHKQTRPLVIQLQIKGLEKEQIKSIDAIFNGIALERHVNDGFPPVNGQKRPKALRKGKMAYNFNYIGQNEGDLWYEDKKTLLGIDGTGMQTIDLNIRFGDGVTRSLHADLTDAMDGFHSEDLGEDFDNPWYILLVLNVGALDIDIEDWGDGGESWIVIEK